MLELGAYQAKQARAKNLPIRREIGLIRGLSLGPSLLTALSFAEDGTVDGETTGPDALLLKKAIKDTSVLLPLLARRRTEETARRRLPRRRRGRRRRRLRGAKTRGCFGSATFDSRRTGRPPR